MGRPSPGYKVELLDPVTGEPGAAEGEIALDLSDRPVGLMTGYHGDPDRTAEAMAGGYYRTGDIGSRDADGYITYVGRTDDVFKASDYKISPSSWRARSWSTRRWPRRPSSPRRTRCGSPCRRRTSCSRRAGSRAPTPRRCCSSTPGRSSPRTSASAGWSSRELPKTVSGKIRRIELREATAAGSDAEYREEDFR